MTGIVLEGALCRVRRYRSDDVDALAALAADPLVSRWMTAGFPHPYTREDAESFIAGATAQSPPQHFAIEAGGEYAGGTGLMPLTGENRGVARFGYWLGRRFWGRGIATDAARVLTRYGLTTAGFRRLEATVFAPNTASSRVLEKCGYTLEARLRETYVQRDGSVCDGFVYAYLARDFTS